MADQWIWWFGPATAALLVALIYNLVPLYPADKVRSKEQHEGGGGPV